MHLHFVYVFLALWLLSVTTASTVYPYIVFLNPSASAFPKPIRKAILHRSVARNTSDISNINYNGYLTQIPEVYSIGNFRWYVDHLNDKDAEILNMRNEILQMHKDDPIFHISEQVQTNLPSWGLDRIDQRKGGDDKFHYPSSAGEGVDIYLIDTGINVEHVDFDGRAKHGPTFVTRSEDPGDANGHGSFVAGICCGRVHGVAKKANVISLKALDQGGSGRLSNILLALHWIVKRHIANPGAKSIVNLSLASEFHLPTNQAIEEAIKLGIHFSIAAGNQGNDACKYSPASVKSALVVGATDKDDSIASYSNFGSCVSIYAPGTSITSIWHTHKTSEHTLSGTSMAAPHVTGVMALLLSEQDYSPSELINKIKETATALLGSKTKIASIVDKISRLIGVDYEDTDIIKLLYLDWSSDSFATSNLPFTSSTSAMRLSITYYIIQLVLSFIFSGFFIL